MGLKAAILAKANKKSNTSTALNPKDSSPSSSADSSCNETQRPAWDSYEAFIQQAEKAERKRVAREERLRREALAADADGGTKAWLRGNGLTS